MKVRGIEEYEEDGRDLMFATVQLVNRQGRDAEGEAKSDAGLRRVKVPDSCAAIIHRRIVGKAAGDYAFTTAKGSRWHQQNFLNRT